MTLRVRLLSLTLLIMAIVAVPLTAVSVSSLARTSVEVAAEASNFAGEQVQSYIQRRSREPATRPANPGRTTSIEATKQYWRDMVAGDYELAALLEQTMAASSSIVEINIAGERGIVLASSNPQQVGMRMVQKEALRRLQDASPWERLSAIYRAHDDYETRTPLGTTGQKTPVFTIQVLVSPALLRAPTLARLSALAEALTAAMIMALLLAFWLTNLAIRPLTRISHLIDDIASGKAPDIVRARSDEARELAMIESKLSLLGERFRDAREDANQLRTNLEGVLEKLDAGTRQQLEHQIALARRLTAINSLTGRVAHEIKNPLNSITLRIEMLRTRIAEESPDVEPELAILSEEVTRLDRVVRTFLDFNRPVQMVLVDVDVSELAGEILQTLRPETEQKGIEVSLEHPAVPVMVKADADLLRQALLNIVVNALEAMDGGGHLWVTVEDARESCFIRIRDTGPGIPAEQRDKIFQLYFTTKPRGSGIGLAMTFRAVQLHGGTIDIESESGRGTTFRVMLPLTGANRTA